MKILMLHNRYRIPGGEDVSTEAQMRLLRSAGHTVDLAEDTNERIEEMGRLRTAARSLWSPESHADIGRRLADGGYDVMHVQNFFPLHSPSVFHAARRHGVATVLSLRNFRLVCPQGMLYRDGGVCMDCVFEPVAWPAVRHGCYRGSRTGSAVVATMSAGHGAIGTWGSTVDVHVVPSQFAAAVYAAAGWDPDGIEVVPNFVHPDPGPGPGDGDYVLYAGRLTPEKGVRVLLEAWRTRLRHIPLKIAGGGVLKPDVVAAADEVDGIEVLGVRTNDEISELMGRAAVVVSPTLGIETFGRVAAEAAARGTPVVASDLGGLAEIVVDGVTGRLVPAGDATAFADAVEELWDAPATTGAMRAAARDRYLSHYGSDTAVRDWERVYALAIARRA